MTTVGKLALQALAAAFVLAALVGSAKADTIVDHWNEVKPPPPVKLEPVTVDPKTTALLVLDLMRANCDPKTRPDCVARLPLEARLIAGARKSHAMVVYSITTTPGSSVADIWPQVKPIAGEPVLHASVDKFQGSGLEQMLRDKGITTVIVTGTGANGAVLYTASRAALLGFHTIVPLDGMSASNPYAEQYVAWHLVNANPGILKNVTLTRIDMVKY